MSVESQYRFLKNKYLQSGASQGNKIQRCFQDEFFDYIICDEVSYSSWTGIFIHKKDNYLFPMIVHADNRQGFITYSVLIHDGVQWNSRLNQYPIIEFIKEEMKTKTFIKKKDSIDTETKAVICSTAICGKILNVASTLDYDIVFKYDNKRNAWTLSFRKSSGPKYSLAGSFNGSIAVVTLYDSKMNAIAKNQVSEKLDEILSA